MLERNIILLVVLCNSLLCLSIPLEGNFEGLPSPRVPFIKIRAQMLQRNIPGQQQHLFLQGRSRIAQDTKELGPNILQQSNQDGSPAQQGIEFSQEAGRGPNEMSGTSFYSHSPSQKYQRIKPRVNFPKIGNVPVPGIATFRKENVESEVEFETGPEESNRPKKEPPFVKSPTEGREEDKSVTGVVEDDWHDPSALDVIDREGPRQTGFPKLQRLAGQPTESQAGDNVSSQAGFSFDQAFPSDPALTGQSVRPPPRFDNSRPPSQIFGQAIVDHRPPALRQEQPNLNYIRPKSFSTTTTPRPEESWSAERAKYSFSTDQLDKISDLTHTRIETRSDGTVQGSYSYSDGFFLRHVQYIADKNGYRIVGESNTPLNPDGPLVNPLGTAAVSADVDGNGYKYVVRGEDLLHSRRYQPAARQVDE